jgi:hypothetical protein
MPYVADVVVMMTSAFASHIFQQFQNCVLGNPGHTAGGIDRYAFY